MWKVLVFHLARNLGMACGVDPWPCGSSTIIAMNPVLSVCRLTAPDQPPLSKKLVTLLLFTTSEQHPAVEFHRGLSQQLFAVCQANFVMGLFLKLSGFSVCYGLVLCSLRLIDVVRQQRQQQKGSSPHHG